MGLGQGRGVQSLTGTCASSSALVEEAAPRQSGHVTRARARRVRREPKSPQETPRRGKPPREGSQCVFLCPSVCLFSFCSSFAFSTAVFHAAQPLSDTPASPSAPHRSRARGRPAGGPQPASPLPGSPLTFAGSVGPRRGGRDGVGRAWPRRASAAPYGCPGCSPRSRASAGGLAAPSY